MPATDPRLDAIRAYLAHLRQQQAHWFTRAHAESRAADPESHTRHAMYMTIAEDLAAILDAEYDAADDDAPADGSPATGQYWGLY